MTRVRSRWSLSGAFALAAAGCDEAYQRHDPSPDAAALLAQTTDASPDAGGERLMGVDPEIREAFDGRGVEPGPITSLEIEGGNINWPRGMNRLHNVGDQLLLVGSGVEPGRSWAVPILRFTPHENGTTSNRALTWLTLGMNLYRPTEITSAQIGDQIIVCSRDHWNMDEPDDRRAFCGELSMPGGTPSFSSQWSEGRVTSIQVRAANGRFVTITYNLQPQARWRVQPISRGALDAGAPLASAEPRCPTLRASGVVAGSDVWILLNNQDPARCGGRGQTISVSATELQSGRPVFAPYDIDVSFGSSLPDGGALSVNDVPNAGADPQEGLTMFATRQLGPDEWGRRDSYLFRLYRDGTWGARKVDEGGILQWTLPQPGGGWIVSLLRNDPAAGNRHTEILLLDANGRRLAAPVPYARANLLNDLGYGVEASGRGLWVVDVERAPENPERAHFRLHRIALRPPAR